MDFLIEFEASDNPTLFTIKLGSTHTWLGMELHMDPHIGTSNDIGRKLVRQCEEARHIIDNAKIMSSKDLTSTTDKTETRENIR